VLFWPHGLIQFVNSHWKTNEIVSADEFRDQVDPQHHTSRFYRAHLQEALLAHVDGGTIHLGKAFSHVSRDKDADELQISFQDGSTATADILLGADGISSAVRRHYVPDSVNQWTGWVAFRSVFNADLLPSDFDASLEEANHWWSSERTFFASKLGKNLFTIVGGWHSNPEDSDAAYKDAVWNSDGDIETVKDLYKDWHPTIRQLIDAAPYVRQYPNTYASALDTWVHEDGLVTFAGDAAHAHGGAFAAGGSLALDDAYAFALTILHIYPPGAPKPGRSDIAKALRLYEQTRKPHTDRVLSVVHENNRKTVERIGCAETDEQLRKRMSGRQNMAWLQEHDVVGAFHTVLAGPPEASQPQARL
jgi:salicylate hydroxylase